MAIKGKNQEGHIGSENGPSCELDMSCNKEENSSTLLKWSHFFLNNHVYLKGSTFFSFFLRWAMTFCRVKNHKNFKLFFIRQNDFFLT